MLLNGLFILVLSLFGLFIGFQFHQTHPDWTNPLIMVSFFTYIISFVITLGPIVWLYIPEVVQPNIVPYTTMTNWFCACLIITLFPVIR
jgi:FtsH-binding integral membrane protein